MAIAEKKEIINSNKETINGLAERVYAAGQKSEWDTFWDAFQENGQRETYQYAFGGECWTSETFNPKHPFSSVRAPYMMFMGSALEYIPIIQFHPKATYGDVFRGAKNLKTIEKLVFTQDATYAPNIGSGCFQDCAALENLIIEGTIYSSGLNVSWSTKLTHESLMSIINALADRSGNTSQTWTVTLGATNLAKLTDEEKQIAQGKGWVLA